MSRNASGTYTAPSNSFNPAVEGTEIDEGDWNTTLDDIVAALTESTFTAGMGSTDNVLVRTDGTSGKKTQGTSIVVDDSDNVSGMATLTLPNTGLHLLDTNASHDLILAPGSDLSADRTLTITTGDADRTLTITADASVGGTAYVVSGTDVALADGGTGASLADPGADRLMFWDDSEGTMAWLTPGTGLTITGTQIDVSSGAGDVTAAANFAVDNVMLRSDGTVKGAQSTGITVDDTNNITGVTSIATTTIELGHASDTTLARSGAGDITIEGNAVYRAGGTDVPLADGGTGASLSDPGADRIMAWDDSAGTVKFMPLADIDVEAGPASGDYLLAYTAEGALVGVNWSSLPGAGSGESNTASNVGTAGVGVFKQKTGVDLEFKKINAGSAKVTITDDTGDNEIDIDVASASDSQAGAVELATTAEAQTGTDTARAVTPAGLTAATVMQGKHTIWVPAVAMTPRVTTNGAARGSVELTTNDVALPTLDFDQTTEEGVGFFIAFPKSWNESTVTFQPIWTAASGSGGVVFSMQAVATSNDDALDATLGTGQTSTDTLLAANDNHTGPESSAITIGGTPAEGDLVYFEITREVSDGSDTLTADAKLIGVKLFYTINAATDA